MVNQDLLGLAPCPFCGGEAVIWPVVRPSCFQVGCKSCGGRSDGFAEPGEAARAWNTRALSAECGVKALEWRDHRPDSFPEPAWSAQTPFGFYNIEEVSASDSPRYVVRLHAHHFIADKDGLPEAKAAAQADFDQRIRSALAPGVVGEAVAEISDQDMRDLLSSKDVGTGRARLRRLLGVKRTAPASPSAGVREALETVLAALKSIRSLVHEGGAPRYSVTPGAALNSVIEEDVDPAIKVGKVALGLGESSTSSGGAAPPFNFDRYINGALMAEGVSIERQATLEGAMKEAARTASRGPNGEVPVPVYRPAADRERIARDDSALLDWLRDETCDLRCINAPTGGDDYDVRWQVIQHHMAEPRERVIGQSYSEEPRDAIRDAIAGGDR